jgi:hypothetical protein
MNITKFSQACIKSFIILTGLINLTLINSCQNQDSEFSQAFLGSPKDAQISIRFIPKDWLLKHTSDNVKTNNSKEIDFSFFNTLSPNTPNIQNVIENTLKLAPDLSKNWIINSGIYKNSKYISIYLKANNTTLIDSLVEKKAIKSKDEINGIKTYQVDDKTNDHNFIVFSDDHLLLIKTYGNESDSKELIKTCLYNSKEDYIKHFETLFGTSRNDLDIRFKGDKEIAKLIDLPIFHELSATLDASIGLNLKENEIELIVDPLKSSTPIDSIFKPFKAQDEAYTSLQMSIDLNKLKSFLLQFKYLDDIEFELKKGKLSYSTLSTLWNGLIQLSYNGKINKQEKSISYEFDENFNEVEKVKYSNIESHDLEGSIGIINTKTSLEYLLKNNLISKTKNNTYEPIVGSQSKIQFNKNNIEIGKAKNHDAYTNKIKLLVAVNDLDKLPIPKKINQTLSLFQLQKAKIIINENNVLELKIHFKGGKYEYIKNVWSFLNPEIK